MHQFAEKFEQTLEDILEDARKRIEVEEEELDEARERRNRMRSALVREFPGSRTYLNGSVAHGDALTPLTDVDFGIIVAEAVDTHGPGKRGPRDLMDRAADAIRRELKDDYPRLSVTVEGQKRAVLVRFRDPVTPGADDFTADIIVALDDRNGAGLFIPRLPTWDRSHPQEHTRLVKQANKESRSTYARSVRLIKHWCRRNGKPLCSWNIKALGLDCITTPAPMLDALETWFKYAHDELSQGLTEDPARVAPLPIKLNEPKQTVLNRLEQASTRLAKARNYERQGYLLMAQKELADLFNDPEMLPYPEEAQLLTETASWRRAHAPGIVTSVAPAAAASTTVRPRAWRP